MDEDLKQVLEEIRDAAIDESLAETEEEPLEMKEAKPWSQVTEERYRPELVKRVEALERNKQSEDSKLRNMSSEDRRIYLFNQAKKTGSSNDWTQVIKQLI